MGRSGSYADPPKHFLGRRTGDRRVLSEIEQARLRLSKDTDAKKKSQLGQFLTPSGTTAFMAGLFPPADGICRLLDAGAGIGSLAAAFLERWRSGGLRFQRVELDAFEVDSSLHAELARPCRSTETTSFPRRSMVKTASMPPSTRFPVACSDVPPKI